MRGFLIIGNNAVGKPFNLNDLPGNGRMDILCRFVAQSLFISHGIRRDVEVYLLLLGNPNDPKTIKISGRYVRGMRPDERSIGGLINKALRIRYTDGWVMSTPGIFVSRKDLSDLLKDICKEKKYNTIAYLREDGKDIRDFIKKEKNDILFITGDHLGLNDDNEKIVLNNTENIVAIPTLSLQADQCIVIINYELDLLEKNAI
ncbi:MAG: tRNA (pseudouridine(54)-N(1))-methyltransferase TrmY [Candidatus Methanoliparum thermophilum]|uniref:tRNA (pseudouridine(54)-N(1))-methyltransferase n=1 Tax=Methanoliparum thermophilum TaxID=2491083 RepID=A0A520KSR7_METT2|nr:tRNA (pseudouridine(54)-N(1))-methyltransferase TrmY [Candidatus Methanoliparum sp. LAM-1]RZN64968.1 MAG: tRNA (pseudouridine(54)-N(1))-methyltransferase TrmY [Candidatus Methanoliparum thermophilum]BDC36149.1 tRNA (pseudouridine(54)-N(1))-methyltransferase TrmY [Candidatus Methanoliparum sp. LAM-1]